MRVLNAHLGTVRTEARVAGVRLVAAPARPPEKQDGLFDAGLRDPASFWENIARIAAIVGDDRVGTPALADTHRPDAFVLERPSEAVTPSVEAPVHPPCGPTLRRLRRGLALPAGGRAAGGRRARRARPVALRGRLVEAAGMGRRDLAGRAGRGRRLPDRLHGRRLVRRGHPGLGPGLQRGLRQCRSSSSMRAARSPSCARARFRRPLSPRPPGWACRPWRCATATASTAPCGSMCRAARPACGPLSDARSRWRTAASCRSSSPRGRATGGSAAC